MNSQGMAPEKGKACGHYQKGAKRKADSGSVGVRLMQNGNAKGHQGTARYQLSCAIGATSGTEQVTEAPCCPKQNDETDEAKRVFVGGYSNNRRAPISA